MTTSCNHSLSYDIYNNLEPAHFLSEAISLVTDDTIKKYLPGSTQIRIRHINN